MKEISNRIISSKACETGRLARGSDIFQPAAGLLVLGLLLVFLGTTGCGTKEAGKEIPKVTQEIDTLAEAKSLFYESYEELEAAAEVIVKVRKTGQENNVINNLGNPGASWGYTESMVQIEEIMKNVSGQQIGGKDNIRIFENQFSYIDGDTQVTCHVNQYQKMEPGKEYVLYLKYSEQDEWYYPLGGFEGKIPLSGREDILFPAAQLSGFQEQNGYDDTWERQFMEDIRRKCMEKYCCENSN